MGSRSPHSGLGSIEGGAETAYLATLRASRPLAAASSALQRLAARRDWREALTSVGFVARWIDGGAAPCVRHSISSGAKEGPVLARAGPGA